MRIMCIPLFALSWLILALGGCSSPPQRLACLDLAQWRADSLGTQGYRRKAVEEGCILFEGLLNLDRESVVELLGAPNWDVHAPAGGQMRYVLLSPEPVEGENDAGWLQCLVLEIGVEGKVIAQRIEDAVRSESGSVQLTADTVG